MAICPTCQASFNEVVDQPTPQNTPSIPQATDLQSVIYAVQQLTQGYNQLTGRTGQPGQQGRTGQPGQQGRAGQAPKSKIGRFQELTQQRVTAKVKVYSKQDPETFVEYKQINAMTFKDTVTGEQWNWARGSQ